MNFRMEMMMEPTDSNANQETLPTASNGDSGMKNKKHTATECLQQMMAADIRLYEKCLETIGFAYWFNQLAILAREKAPQATPTAADEIWNETETQQQIEMLTTNFYDDPLYIAEKAFKAGFKAALDQDTGLLFLDSSLQTDSESVKFKSQGPKEQYVEDRLRERIQKLETENKWLSERADEIWTSYQDALGKLRVALEAKGPAK